MTPQPVGGDSRSTTSARRISRTTLEALSDRMRGSPWGDPEVVIVDDGSEPPVRPRAVDGATVRVIRQPNRGRFEARRAGIEAAAGEYVLLLDARVTLDPNGLAWVAERVDAGELCMERALHDGEPGLTLRSLLERADVLRVRRLPGRSSDDVVHARRVRPLSPRAQVTSWLPVAWLMDAIAGFELTVQRLAVQLRRHSHAQGDRRRATGSTSRREFASVYRNREALRPFLRHALHRGHDLLRRLLPPRHSVLSRRLAAFPASLGGAVLALRRPRVAALATAGLASSGMAFALNRGRPIDEALSFGMLAPPFAWRSRPGSGAARGWPSERGSRRDRCHLRHYRRANQAGPGYFGARATRPSSPDAVHRSAG